MTLNEFLSWVVWNDYEIELNYKALGKQNMYVEFPDGRRLLVTGLLSTKGNIVLEVGNEYEHI